MGMKWEHGIDDLALDLQLVARRTARALPKVVAKHAREGNTVARRFARRRGGSHGKHYWRAFSAEPVSPLQWVYGPDVNEKQGGMAFEEGPGRQTRPHHNLADSADLIGPKFGRAVLETAANEFWPGGDQ